MLHLFFGCFLQGEGVIDVATNACYIYCKAGHYVFFSGVGPLSFSNMLLVREVRYMTFSHSSYFVREVRYMTFSHSSYLRPHVVDSFCFAGMDMGPFLLSLVIPPPLIPQLGVLITSIIVRDYIHMSPHELGPVYWPNSVSHYFNTLNSVHN
jgi:hypothetical protein